MKSTHHYPLPVAAGKDLAIPTDLLIGNRWREGSERQRIDVAIPRPETR